MRTCHRAALIKEISRVQRATVVSLNEDPDIPIFLLSRGRPGCWLASASSVDISDLKIKVPLALRTFSLKSIIQFKIFYFTAHHTFIYLVNILYEQSRLSSET